MFDRVRTRRFAALAALPVALVVVLLLTQATAAGSGCTSVKGKFTLIAVDGPDCVSPVGICVSLAYKGGLKGSGFFTGSSITPSADTPTTGVVFANGDNVITVDGGTLLTKDAITLKTTGAGEFAEVDVIVGGTGQWQGASGTLTGTGVFASGSGTGDYTGTVCRP